MAKDTQDRTETLHEHREALQRAKAALYETTTVDRDFHEARPVLDALMELAQVSIDLWDTSTTLRDRDAPEDPPAGKLHRRKVMNMAPMRKGVAWAIFDHADRMEKIHEKLRSEIIDYEEIVQELVRALAGYGDDVGMPVLEAAKTLDLSHEEEA